jgi:hypothetical protein
MISSEIKARIAKVMRMQESSNANEAANATDFLEKLCRQHGITANDINADYDPERDDVTVVELFRGKRLDKAESWVLNSITKFFNGRLIQFGGRREGNTLKIVASKGNQIQIELYFDYIMEVMTKLADEAKAANPNSPRSFKADFRKGFALTIGSRLRYMKETRDGYDTGIKTPGLTVADKDARELKAVKGDAGNSNNGPGLTVADKDARELNAVNAYVDGSFGKITTTKSTCVTRSGTRMGAQAANGVGLNTQVSGSHGLALRGS